MARKKLKAESDEDSPSSEEQEYQDQANPKKKGKKSASKKPITKVNVPNKASKPAKSPKIEQKPKKTETKDDSKVDFLPGQKYPTPDEEDGACAFYKSLYQKNPQSEMARKYCLEYGVLEEHEATRLAKQMQKQKK